MTCGNVEGTCKRLLSIVDSRSHTFTITLYFVFDLTGFDCPFFSIPNSGLPISRPNLLKRKSLSGYVLHPPINDRLDGHQVLSGFHLDRLVKSFPLLFADGLFSCSSHSRSIVAVYSCHVFST